LRSGGHGYAVVVGAGVVNASSTHVHERHPFVQFHCVKTHSEEQYSGWQDDPPLEGVLVVVRVVVVVVVVVLVVVVTVSLQTQ